MSENIDFAILRRGEGGMNDKVYKVPPQKGCGVAYISTGHVQRESVNLMIQEKKIQPITYHLSSEFSKIQWRRFLEIKFPNNFEQRSRTTHQIKHHFRSSYNDIDMHAKYANLLMKAILKAKGTKINPCTE